MNQQELAAWAASQWMKEAAKRTPGARLKVSLAAGERDFKRKVARERRAIQAKAASKIRAARKRKADSDAERETRLLKLLLSQR